jgi:hypothetical protein
MWPGSAKHGEEVVGSGKAMLAMAFPVLPRAFLIVRLGCPGFAALNPGYV